MGFEVRFTGALHRGGLFASRHRKLRVLGIPEENKGVSSASELHGVPLVGNDVLVKACSLAPVWKLFRVGEILRL